MCGNKTIPHIQTTFVNFSFLTSFFLNTQYITTEKVKNCQIINWRYKIRSLVWIPSYFGVKLVYLGKNFKIELFVKCPGIVWELLNISTKSASEHGSTNCLVIYKVLKAIFTFSEHF